MTFNDLDETIHAHMTVFYLRTMDMERLKGGLDLMSTVAAERSQKISSLETRIVKLGSEYEELKQAHRVQLLKYQALIDSFDNVDKESQVFAGAVNKELAVVRKINESTRAEKTSTTGKILLAGVLLERVQVESGSVRCMFRKVKIDLDFVLFLWVADN